MCSCTQTQSWPVSTPKQNSACEPHLVTPDTQCSHYSLVKTVSISKKWLMFKQTIFIDNRYFFPILILNLAYLDSWLCIHIPQYTQETVASVHTLLEIWYLQFLFV